MADNVAITAGSGTTIATDDIGGVHYQKVKMIWGPSDTATQTDTGASAVPIQDGGNSITVDGTVSLTGAIPTGTNRIGNVGINDGTTTAEVVPRTNYNALATTIVDGNGDPITSFDETQYADGASAATPTGTQTNWNESGTQRSVSLSKPLPIQYGTSKSSSATLTAANQALTLTNISNAPVVTIEVRGTFNGGVSFEGTYDDINWIPVYGYLIGSDGYNVTSTAATGAYKLTTPGFTSVRAGCSYLISGSINVNATASYATSGLISGEKLFVAPAANTTFAATQSGTWSNRITDGTTTAEVMPLTGYNGLAVGIVDGSGNQITSFGGGTQYTDGDNDPTPTGTVAMFLDVATGDILAVSEDNPLPTTGGGGGGGGNVNITEILGSAVSNTNPLYVAPSTTAVFVVSDGGGSLTVDGSVTVSDGGGSLTVDGTVAATQSGTWNVNTVSTVTTVSGIPSIPAGTNLMGRVSSSDETSTIYNGTTAITPKYAAVSAGSSGNNTLISSVSGKKIRVIAGYLSCSGSVNAKFQNGAGGTDLTGYLYGTTNSGIVLPYNPVGWFETSATTLLNLSLSGATTVGGTLVYLEV